MLCYIYKVIMLMNGCSDFLIKLPWKMKSKGYEDLKKTANSSARIMVLQ